MVRLVAALEGNQLIEEKPSRVGRVDGDLFRAARASRQRRTERVGKQHRVIESLAAKAAGLADEMGSAAKNTAGAAK